MLFPLLLSLAPLVAPRQDDPAIIVRLNHDRFEVGDHGRIYVKTARDGYLVILHADPQGRVRVLFPIDPDADNFVRGGKERELRGRSDREPLQMNADGSGTVLAIFSLDAFKFDELTRNGHWDFATLGGPDESVKHDPLAGLLEIANNMARESQFDYDAATYVVMSEQYAAEDGYGGYGHGYSHVGIHLAFGYPVGFGFSYGYPFYDPFYGYWGFGAGYPYYPYYPRYGYPGYRTPVVFAGAGGFTRKAGGNLPHFDPVQPRTRSGFNDPVPVRSRGVDARRSIEPRRSVEPRGRSIERRTPAAPSSRGIAPRNGTSRRSFGGGWSSVSRGFSRNFGGGGVSRSFGGFGGTRGGTRGGFTGGRRR